MAKITQQADINLTFTFTINEAEARALDALVGYGTDEVLRVFMEHLGSHYMKAHTGGLKTFLSDVRAIIPPMLSRLDEARKTFQK